MQNTTKNRCRICLGDQTVADMFTNKISKKVTYCTTVQVSPEDPFPSKICQKCGFYLNVAYVFRLVCEWTDSKLRQELQQTNSIKTAINNTQQAQWNEFSCVEHNQNRKHVIESLLKRDFLETYKFFTSKDNEVKRQENQALGDTENDINNIQTLTEKNMNCIPHDLCSKSFNEEIETTNEEVITQLHQETEAIEPINVPVNSVKEDSDFHNEKISFVVKNNNIINNSRGNAINFVEETSVNENNGSVDEPNCTINEDLLSSEEEDSVVVIPLLQNEDVVLKGDVINEEQNFMDDEIRHEECLDNVEVENDVLNIEECEEINVEYTLVDNSINNEEVNCIDEKTAIEQHILDEENVFVDEGLIYECETHQDIYNKPIYGKVCLNTVDPLLHNVITSQTILLENEETDLGNVQTNQKSCICVQNRQENVEKPPNKKHITLSNISLNDFENFENEQLNNALPSENDHVENDRNRKLNNKALAKNLAMGQSENRVGRHIAKKNAGQPPKRYSPTPETIKLTSKTRNLKEINTTDDSPVVTKHTKVDAEDKLEKKTELKDVNSILDQEYILESDLSMPGPIFEETIVTDGFYFASDEELLETNVNHQENKTSAKMESQVKRNQRRRRRSKIGSRKLQKKVNVFIDQTVMNPVRPKRNKYSIKKHTNKSKQQNDLHTNSNGIEINDDNDCDYNSETKIKTKSSNYSSDDDDDDDDNYVNAQQSHISTKRFSNKKMKKRNGTGNTCKLCNKSFPFPSRLQRHLTAHLGIKRFVCKHCNKEFLHRYNLSVHMRSHTGNFPLQCNICHRGFASPSVLERHKRSHTGETPFQCQYCLQLFSHASSLNMHEKMHLNRPSFPCDVCYKVFSYKSSLNAHKKGHSGFKPHSCSVCHKRFTRRTSVLRHMSCHSEVKNFKCRTCGEVLSSQSNLVKHRKIHQGLCS